MGDSARAGTIQLPRAARAASAGRRPPRRVRRPLPPRQVWSSGSPRVGGRAEVQPSRSHHSGRPRAPATGLWPRGFLPLMPNSAGGPVPAAGFPALPALTPRMPRPVPPSQEKAAASPVSRTLPAGPRENPRLLGGPSVRVLGEGRHHVVAAALGRSVPAGPSPGA